MSLILDALNKADNERKKSDAPSLASIHSSGADPAITRRNRIIILGLSGSVVVLAFALLGILVEKKYSPEEATTPVVANQSRIPEVDKPAKSQPIIQPTGQSGLAVSPTTQESPAAQAAVRSDEVDTGSETYKQMQQKLIAEQYRLANQTKEEESAPAVDTKVAGIYEQSRATPAPAPLPTPAPTPQATVQATPLPTAMPTPIELQSQTPIVQSTAATASHFTGRKTLSHYPELSAIGELPFSIQKDIPTIMYSEHFYSASNPSVTLNNTRRTNGQQIANELILEEILEDGIILRYKSRKFKMDAMNSWINI